MKVIIPLADIQSLVRRQYNLPPEAMIVISRSGKVSTESKSPIGTLGPLISPDIKVFVEQIDSLLPGHLIAAIKAYRTRVNNGLKEAKDLIENWPVTRKYIVRHNKIPTCDLETR